jgi:hypothetical protein
MVVETIPQSLIYSYLDLPFSAQSGNPNESLDTNGHYGDFMVIFSYFFLAPNAIHMPCQGGRSQPKGLLGDLPIALKTGALGESLQLQLDGDQGTTAGAIELATVSTGRCWS